jgi:hypothetical protein
VWAIHLYCTQQPEFPNIWQVFQQTFSLARNKSEASYFMRVYHALLSVGLIEQKTTLNYLVQNISPRFLALHYPAIVRHFSLIRDAFRPQSEFRREYSDCLGPLLQSERIQLVQLAIAYDDPDPAEGDPLWQLQTDETAARSRVILDLVRGQRCRLSTAYRNVTFSLFPLLDSEVVIRALRPKWRYLSEEETDSFVLTMVRSVLWFFVESAAVAATIAATIKYCLNGRRFPFTDFVDCLYANSDCITRFSYLFVELQFQNMFSYSTFLTVIYRRGFLSSRSEATLSLLLSLPSLDRSVTQLTRLSRALQRLGVSSTYEDLILRIGELPASAFRGLPALYRFNVGQWLVDRAIDFSSAAADLASLDLPSLIPTLFLKLRPTTFSTRDLRALEAAAPVLIARGCLPAVAAAAGPDFSRLVRKIERRRSSPSQKGGPRWPAAPRPLLAQGLIRALFERHSMLCSLHVFDASRGIRTERELASLLTAFLRDLLGFEGLTSATLLDFFIAFCEARCADRAPALFLRALAAAADPQTVDGPAGALLAFFLRSVLHGRKRLHTHLVRVRGVRK